VKIAFETYGAAGKGAFQLDGKMIDAPVYKQVSTIRVEFSLVRLKFGQAMKVLAKGRAGGMRAEIEM